MIIGFCVESSKWACSGVASFGTLLLQNTCCKLRIVMDFFPLSFSRFYYANDIECLCGEMTSNLTKILLEQAFKITAKMSLCCFTDHVLFRENGSQWADHHLRMTSSNLELLKVVPHKGWSTVVYSACWNCLLVFWRSFFTSLAQWPYACAQPYRQGGRSHPELPTTPSNSCI